MGLSRKLRREQIKNKHLRKIKNAEDIAKEYFAEGMASVKNDAKDEAAGEILLLCMWTLHADFGFGKDRLLRWVNSIFEFSSTIIDEKISPEEILEMLNMECKTDFGTAIYDIKGQRAKKVRQRRDFLQTYRFMRRITGADREDKAEGAADAQP